MKIYAKCRTARLALALAAGSLTLVPAAVAANPVGLGASVPAGDGAGDAAARPAVITVGRAMDLAGTPLSLVPKGAVAKGPVAKGGMRGSPGAMPYSAPLGLSYITSGFGIRYHPILGGLRLHAGVDLAAPAGSPVYATMDGYVASAGWAGGYGLSIRLTDGVAIETRYGHMSRLAVAAGSYVRKGELIGYVGSTGLSTGPHLHYEVRVNGRPVDPRSTFGK